MRKLLLLRPEPGLSATVRRASALGLETVAVPLFRIEPVEWEAPDPAGYDALLLTSASAVREAGAGIGRLRALPVHAVGSATAAAAREAGLNVDRIGEAGVAELLATLPASTRLLHLGGEHRVAVDSAHRIETRVVYRSAAIDKPGLPLPDGLVAAVHSPRAGERLAELIQDRDGMIIAAISRAAAEACGDGWEKVEVASKPDDESLLALAAMLCQTA